MLTCRKGSNPGNEPFQARSMTFCLEGRHPIHSGGAYSVGSGLNVTLVLLCPRSTCVAPWIACRHFSTGVCNALGFTAL